MQSLLQMTDGNSYCKLARESWIVLNMKFVRTQMLPVFPNVQIGTYPGKTLIDVVAT